MNSKSILPISALDQHLAILGKTGSGKTYTAKGLLEHLLSIKRRACIIDPTGVWWGLKSKADGKGNGYPIVIFGGEHADFPISDKHGIAIAEIVAGSDASYIIDTSDMTVGERTRFFTDFAETILRKNKEDLHLIVDEAHNFAPQGKVPDPQAGKMLYATNNLMSMGRARGLAVMLISQRPQKLHKDSLTQAATLIAMRLMHPLDRKSVEDWIGDNADKDQGKEIIKSLPSLPTGEGWIWSPEVDILKKVKFPKIGTFDSSQKGANKQKVKLAKIDHLDIAKMLDEALAEIKANDPKALKAEIARLRAEADKPGLKNALTELRAAEHKGYEEGYDKGKAAGLKMGIAEGYAKALDILRDNQIGVGDPKILVKQDKHAERAEKFPRERHVTVPSAKLAKALNRGEEFTPRVKTIWDKPEPLMSGPLPEGERKVLIALAQRFPNSCSGEYITIMTGFKRSTRDAYLARLKAKDLIVKDGTAAMATQKGIDILGADYEPLPKGEALRDYWLAKLPDGEKRILQELIQAYPANLTREDLSEFTTFKRSTRDAYIARLKTRKLIRVEGGGICPAADLYN